MEPLEVLPGDEAGPKHPVLASVLMGIIRALNEDSTGPSSSSDDNITCRQHDRRQPPCRRRSHQKSSEIETDKAQEYVLPPPDECLSPTEAPPTPEPIRSPTESPKLHTIVETEEEAEDEAKEREVHTAKDAIKHLQKESIRACSSTSSPLVTSDDSDIAAFLSKHEYATLFGASTTDKILIPTRFVQDYGETSTSSQTSSSKRSSEEELNEVLRKKQKADHSPGESPPKTPKRKLESLFDDTEQEFDQNIDKSDQDAGAVSVHDATSMVQDTDVHRETGSSMDSTSQPKRLKTSDEEFTTYSSEETLFSESIDTMEESTESLIISDRQAKVLGGRKKKLTKILKSDPHEMSDLSSDGQTDILKPSMMPGPKVRLGNYGWAAGRKDAKSMLQKAVSSSLEDLSTEYSESQGKTNTSDTIGSSSSFKSSPVTLSVGDISGSKYKSEISDTSFTSSDFKSVSSSVSSPKIQTSDAPTEGTSETTYENTTTDLESSVLTGTEMYPEIGSVVTSSDKLYTDSTKSSEHTESTLRSSDASSKQISPSLEEHVTTPATVTSISYSTSLSRTSELDDSVEVSSLNTMSRSGASYSKQSSISTRAKSEETATSPTTQTSASYTSSDLSPSDTDASSSDSFVSSLNTTSRSGIDPRDLPTSMSTGTGQPMMNPLDDFYAIPVYSDATSNTSSNASTHLQDSSKTDVTLNRFQPTSDVTSSSFASTSPESSALTASEATTLSLSAGGRRSKTSSNAISTSIVSSSTEYSAVTASEATTSAGRSSKTSSDMTSTSIATSSFESSAVISSSGKSTSLGDGGDSSKDFADMPLSNINLTDALLREDPSLSDLDDSDTLTSSSDEYITHRLMQDTPSTHDRVLSKSHITLEAESIDLPPTITKTIEPEDRLEAPFDEVNEDLFMKDVHGEYLPVLIEDEHEESSDGSQTQIDEDKVDDNLVGDVGSTHEEETSSLQESSTVVSSTVVSSSEVSTLTESKTDDEHSNRLLIIDLGDNDKAFDDILITEDPSDPSFLYEIPSVYDDEHENVIQIPSTSSSESEQTEIEHITTNEYNEIKLSFDVARYVIVNAVATVFTEKVVNVAITQIMVEEDLAFQMERALFPGIGVEDGDEIIHWISPARYRQEKYSGPLRDSEDEGEALSLCLERAFFPCLADSEDTSTRVSSRRSESTYHSIPERTRVQTDVKIKSSTPRNLITFACSQVSTVASRVSAIAVSSVCQTLGIMTFLSWTIWNYIRDSFHESKMQGRDEATQYDYKVNMVDEKSGRSLTEIVKEADDARLNILASKIVTSAVTNAAWDKEYAIPSEQSFPRETLSFTSSDMIVACESDTSIVQFASSVVGDVFTRVISNESLTRDYTLTTTPPDVTTPAKKSEEEYKLRLSASSVVETAVSNALFIHKTIKESPSTTPSVLSIQSDHRSVSSGRSSTGDDISACSLSDIPLSSIKFMRQQLADMRAIFKDTLTGTIAEVGSAPNLALVSTTGADLQSSQQLSNALPLEAEDEATAIQELVSGLEEETATIVEESNNKADTEDTTIHSNELDKVLQANTLDSEHIWKDMRPSSGEGVEPNEKSNEVATEIIDSALKNSRDDPISFDVANERKDKSEKLLLESSASEQKDEVTVNPKDAQDSDSSTSSVSALSLSDVPLSGISYIREQLANVKTIAHSIMADFDSYAEERTLVAKRSSLLTCGSASGRSLSSCDSARTIGNNSSNSLTSLTPQFDEIRKSSSDKENHLLHKDSNIPADDDIVHQVKDKVFPPINGPLERANENGNAKTHINDRAAQSDSKTERELQLANDANNTLDSKTQRQAEGKSTKENMFESSHITNETDRTRTVQMTETHHQARQMATFSRNSPSRRHVISRRKGADHPRGSYSGESTCSTDCSSSIVSTSSFSDGTVSSEQSKKVTIESESQGKGRTDVSCRISDQGIWVNTAFLNEIDDDDRSTSVAADNQNATEKFVKNKIQINVKMSPRKKHHSHRVRSRARDTQLHGAAVANHRALTILDNETLVKNCQEGRMNEMSMKTRADDSRTARRQAYDEVTEGHEYREQSNRASFKHGVSDIHDHRAMELLNKVRPKKNSSLETQCSDMSEKTDEAIDVPAGEIHIKRECLSDGAVSERHPCLCRRQGSIRRKIRGTKPQESSACHSCEARPDDILAAPVISRSERTRAVLSMLDDVAENLSIDPPARDGSVRRKSRDTKPQESPCHSCEEKCAHHPDDILAAPVISRSERTRAVLSMLDDVAENLSIDAPVSDHAGSRTNLRGSFRKLFASRKNKRRSGDKTPESQSPRVLSDSSVTGSDCESGSPDYSSDSSRTPKSHSAASLLSNVLRNLSAKRSKRKLKGASPKTPNGSRARKGSVPAFDEMLGDLDDDCFIDDAFPKLVSTRDSPSEDNTSLNEVLQDLIEEWSFEGLGETLDFTPRTFVERIRDKLNLFMDEIRKEKRKVELRFGRDGS